MADNIFNKLFRGSGAGRPGSEWSGGRFVKDDPGYDKFFDGPGVELNRRQTPNPSALSPEVWDKMMSRDDKPGFDPGSERMPSAREFARTFDPTSNEDVFKMQGMLGLKEDGILGPKTLAALRGLQGVPVEDEDDSGKESIWDRVKGWASSQEGTDRSSAGGRGYGSDSGPRVSIPKEGGLLAKLGILPSGSYDSEKSSDY